VLYLPGEEHEEEPRARHSEHQYRILRVPIAGDTTWNARENEQIADREYQLGRFVALKCKCPRARAGVSWRHELLLRCFRNVRRQIDIFVQFRSTPALTRRANRVTVVRDDKAPRDVKREARGIFHVQAALRCVLENLYFEIIAPQSRMSAT